MISTNISIQSIITLISSSVTDACLVRGMEHHNERFRRRALVRQYAEKRVNRLDKEQWQKDMNRWSKLDFSRTFTPDDQRIPEPPEEAINEVLKIIGQRKP